ncbi:MAG TPA: energy transducer TonB, partial [Anaerovoracaceae bacterium]|nr:energy transducer TonB [Anaerovoracaceae bacterium]
VLPVMATLFYAFATPEYHYPAAPMDDNTVNIYQVPAIVQKEVKGIVLKEDEKPLEGVFVSSTGTAGEASGAETGPDGRFAMSNIKEDASLLFFCRGYKRITLKPVFTSEMIVKMERDPEYKEPAPKPGSGTPAAQRPVPIVVIDGVISDKSFGDARKDLGYDMGIMKMIRGKEATDKYGEKAADGVYEIITRKKAIAMGLKPPFPRLQPEDYPTFQNQQRFSFTDWVVSQAKYPDEARAKNLEGWVTVNFTIELDGSVSNVVSSGLVDPILSNEIVRVIQSSPKWEAPENPAVDEPFSFGITLKFKLPDKIINDAPFVMVEEMPQYPGGDAELLNFIKSNTKYPESAKAEKIQGRVIVRFVVNTDGKTEGLSVLKGVHPLLDAEAVRVISMLSGFRPGMQGGKPVNVWYMVPVTFTLSAPEPLFSRSSENEILKYVGMNTGYPQLARNSSDTGRVYVVVKMGKGGIVKECSAVTEKNEIKVPLMPEVVIIGYNSSTGLQSNAGIKKETSKEHPLLKPECLRVVNNLGELNIPEWKDKDMEFALAFKFILK